MSADNWYYNGAGNLQLAYYGEQATCGWFKSIAFSGSGLINGCDYNGLKYTTGLYNSCWKARVGWDPTAELSLCKMYRAWYNGANDDTNTQPTPNSYLNTPDQYNSSTQAGCCFGAGLLFTRSRIYFGLQVNDSSRGTIRVTEPWFKGPAGGGRQAYLTSFGGTGTIGGLRNSVALGGATNSYNSGAVANSYVRLTAFNTYPYTFSAWRMNSATGTALSTSDDYNFYPLTLDPSDLASLTTVYGVFS
tara:strand:- start:6916 stop:7656 length:741 start_codon:yes stop_codon:yes gene_type:complete